MSDLDCRQRFVISCNVPYNPRNYKFNYLGQERVTIGEREMGISEQIFIELRKTVIQKCHNWMTLKT